MRDVEMAESESERKPSGPYQGLEEPTRYESVNWKKIFFTPKYIPWHILMIAITVLTVLITIHHDEVVTILRPFSEKVRDIPAGWLIPVVILIVISFPPLFGHEIIGLLCGVVYGLWIGFAVVAAGTFLGEVGTWFAFKRLLRNKAIKLERTNLNYAALARVTRNGGFWMVFIIRFSIVPSHFSTAVFSTCDVKFWHFAVSTFLTLPKQIFIVYLGVLLVAQDENNKIQNIVLGVTFVVTLVMGVYIWMKMKKAKVQLLEEQESKRQEYDLQRFSQRQRGDSGASSFNKPELQYVEPEPETSDMRLDLPLGYQSYPPQEVGVAMGGVPGEARPTLSRFNSTDSRFGRSTGPAPLVIGASSNNNNAGQSQQSPTPWRMDQKPYYPGSPPVQQPPGRDWV